MIYDNNTNTRTNSNTTSNTNHKDVLEEHDADGRPPVAAGAPDLLHVILLYTIVISLSLYIYIYIYDIIIYSNL